MNDQRKNENETTIRATKHRWLLGCGLLLIAHASAVAQPGQPPADPPRASPPPTFEARVATASAPCANEASAMGVRAMAARRPSDARAGARPVVVGPGLVDRDGGVDSPTDLPPPSRRSRLYAFLARQGAREIRLARRLTRAAFEAHHRALTAQGFHLESFEVVRDGATPCFSGIWNYGRKRQLLELGQTKRLFATTFLGAAFDALGGKDVESYLENGERRFAGLWQEGEGGNTVLLDVDADEVRAEQRRGRAIVDLESWPVAGGRRYLALHRRSEVATRLVLDLPADELVTRVESLVADGFRPLELEIENDGGRPRFSSVWERSPEAFWMFIGLSEELQDCRLLSLRIESPAFEHPAVSADDCRTLGRPVITVPPPDGVFTEAAPAAAAADARVRAWRGERREPARAGTPTPSRTRQLAATVARVGLDDVPVPSEPLHIVDFVVTRVPLVVSVSSSTPIHRGVIHDTGSSGPGG